MIIDFRGEWVGWRKFWVGVVCGSSSYYFPYNGIIPQITRYNTKMNKNSDDSQVISKKIYISIVYVCRISLYDLYPVVILKLMLNVIFLLNRFSRESKLYKTLRFKKIILEDTLDMNQISCHM